MHKPGNFIDDFCTILHKQHALKDRDVSALKKTFSERSDLTFEEFLVDENIISREQLFAALAEYYETSAIDVIGVFFDHHLVRMFPKDVLLRNNFIPFERDGEVLSIIAGRPDDEELPEIVGKYVSYDVTVYAGFFRDIQSEIVEFYDLPVGEPDLEVEEHDNLELKESITEQEAEVDETLQKED